jgi:hypothetical protein
MRHTFRILLLAVFAIGPPMVAHASDNDEVAPDKARPTFFFPHIRTSDPQMRALIDDATETSAIVRALVARITASDVVVYIACESDPGVRAPGRLNFMAAAGGLRYVVIRLQPKRRAAEIAMLAHELQHAVEIADTPSIVDEASLAREYARIGYRSRSAHGLAFDTKAAVEIGRRVAEELMTAEPIVGRALPGAPGGPDKVRPTD